MGTTSQSTLPSAAADGHIFPIGEILDDTYEIRGCLGEGGMSQVFEAHDLALNRTVAVKACWPDPRAPSLRKEAQALAVLRHPNLAVVHAFGRHQGTEYLVMERIYGETLKQHLEQRGRLGVGEALAILNALAQTLEVVHRAGVVHRDVKPANVILSPGERTVLVDFGIYAAEFELGQLDSIAGTPQYLAPELLERPLKPGEGPLVDIYSLGMTGYEMLAGKSPFEGMGLAQMVVQPPLANLRTLRPEIPRPVAGLIASMVERDPEARPQTMEEVLIRLRLATAPPSPARRFSALVVDDHGGTLDLLQHSLARALPQAEILICASAKEAIAQVQRRAPDVIIVDLEMPGMNGIELCLYLRGTQLAAAATLIVVSGRAQPPDGQLLGQLGVSQFIWKGGECVARLVAAVRELEQRRLAADGCHDA